MTKRITEMLIPVMYTTSKKANPAVLACGKDLFAITIVCRGG